MFLVAAGEKKGHGVNRRRCSPAVKGLCYSPTAFYYPLEENAERV